MGHAAKVTAGEDINLNSVQGGKVNLYIGDSRYGAPTSIVAKNIVMSGAGENKVIFNNTKPTQPGTDGYLFNVSINGEGTVEQQSGHTTLGVASDYKGGTIINGGLLSIANNKALGMKMSLSIPIPMIIKPDLISHILMAPHLRINY